MIKTILLLPHADTRERLLAPGAPVWERRDGFGWVVLGLDRDGDVRVYWDDEDAGWCCVEDWPVHLVLARDGAEVYEGTDRLRRVIGAEKSVGFLIPPKVPPALHEAYRLARYAEWAGLGTLLLLDAAGEVVDG